MSLKLYLDFLSQPSRALYIFLKLNKIPFETCRVALGKGEHLTEDFKTKFNRFQRVPFIHDSNFQLGESVAIVRYVANKHNLDNNWYPRDSQAQAKVDEYLEWQHNNTRAMGVLLFQKKWLLPLLTGKPSDPAQIQKHEENFAKCLKSIETLWLADRPYLSGEKISVADIFAASEIEQQRIIGFDPNEGRPVLAAWLDKVRKECSPCYEEAHTVLNKLVAKGGKL